MYFTLSIKDLGIGGRDVGGICVLLEDIEGSFRTWTKEQEGIVAFSFVRRFDTSSVLVWLCSCVRGS